MSQKGSLNAQERQHHDGLFGSIKNKSLLKLAALYYTFFYGSPTGPREAIKQRLWAKGIPLYNNHIAYELKPSDVAPIIHCCKTNA